MAAVLVVMKLSRERVKTVLELREFTVYKTSMITEEDPLWVIVLLGSRFLSRITSSYINSGGDQLHVGKHGAQNTKAGEGVF